MIIGIGLYLSVFIGAYKHIQAVEIYNEISRTFWILSYAGNIIWIPIRWYFLPQGSCTKHSSVSEDRNFPPGKAFCIWAKLHLEGQYGDASHKMISKPICELCEAAPFPDLSYRFYFHPWGICQTPIPYAGEKKKNKRKMKSSFLCKWERSQLPLS